MPDSFWAFLAVAVPSIVTAVIGMDRRGRAMLRADKAALAVRLTETENRNRDLQVRVAECQDDARRAEERCEAEREMNQGTISRLEGVIREQDHQIRGLQQTVINLQDINGRLQAEPERRRRGGQ